MISNMSGGSHIPILLEVLSKTKGPVLELGAGWYSTPLLYWLCKEQGRGFVSYETDEDWAKNMDGMTQYVKRYDDVPADKEWGMVFIDHAPAERRIVDIKRFRELADYIVVHDTEPESKTLYEYYKIFPSFPHKKTYDKHKPHTTILSTKYEL